MAKYAVTGSCGTTRSEYKEQGKSNRFIAAQAEGRLTAGEAAKLLTKRLGQKIRAIDLEPFATEYHHAGRFGAGKAKRVFFFSSEELEKITLQQIEEKRGGVWGWVLGFETSYGRYGKKQYVPVVAEVGLIPAARAKRLGNKFHPLTQAEAQEATTSVGKRLPPFSINWREAA